LEIELTIDRAECCFCDFSVNNIKYRDKLKCNSSKDFERKLKIERVEVCLNCQLFTKCENIGRYEDCEKFVEVEKEKAMVIVRLDEYAKLESSKK